MTEDEIQLKNLNEAYAFHSKCEETIRALEAEILEQCRLNGMGSEREAALLGKIQQLEWQVKVLREGIETALDRSVCVSGDDAREVLNVTLKASEKWAGRGENE